MLIKSKDNLESSISRLKELLEQDISEKQRFLIEREISNSIKGIEGEKTASYYIDFSYGNSDNWAVIHDLRLEHNGKVAQIDHLLINRFLDFYVLESKSFGNGVAINAYAEFEAFYGTRKFGIPSPIEQNNRHIKVLNECLKDNNLIPSRLGLRLTPSFFSFVLISPKSIIKRQKQIQDTIQIDQVIKADAIETKIHAEMTGRGKSGSQIISTLGKICSQETIQTLANKLVSLHQPAQIDYAQKFNITADTGDIKNPETSDSTEMSSKKYFCAKCRTGVSEKVAKFCWSNTKKFNGLVYCFQCQKNRANP